MQIQHPKGNIPTETVILLKHIPELYPGLTVYTKEGNPIKFVTQHSEAIILQVAEPNLLELEAKQDEELEIIKQELTSFENVPIKRIKEIRDIEAEIKETKDCESENKDLETGIHEINDTRNKTKNELKLSRRSICIVEERYYNFWVKPRARQYIIDHILYEEREERRVTWYELFTDLILIAAIAKTKYLMSNSWYTYFQFLLVFSCIISHWIQTMM
jgi:hypothetical protein